MSQSSTKKKSTKNFRIPRPLNFTVHGRFRVDSAVFLPALLALSLSPLLNSSRLVVWTKTSFFITDQQYSTYGILSVHNTSAVSFDFGYHPTLTESFTSPIQDYSFLSTFFESTLHSLRKPLSSLFASTLYIVPHRIQLIICSSPLLRILFIQSTFGQLSKHKPFVTSTTSGFFIFPFEESNKNNDCPFYHCF